jgi:hypothetical protein
MRGRNTTVYASRKKSRILMMTVAWQDVVAILGVLQYNFAPGVKAQNAAVRASNIERQRPALICKCSREVGGPSHESGANLWQVLK